MPELVLRMRPLPPAQPLPAEEPRPPAEPSRSARHVVDLGGHQRSGPTQTPLARWMASVATAHEPCLVLDVHGRVVSISEPAALLLGCSGDGVIGRPLLTVVDVVDFDTGASGADYAPRVAPLAVLVEGNAIVRSLLRVRLENGVVTLDAAAAPLHDARGALLGSLTFFAPIGR